MNIQNFAFNPFALLTAQNGWQAATNSPLTNLYNGVVNTLYDLYVKNPSDMIVGNVKALTKTAALCSTKTKIAVAATAVFSTLYYLMFFGTTFYFTGQCLFALGTKTNLIPLIKIGAIASKIGNNLFMSGAVPLYALFYALPKFLISSMPKVMNFLNEQITKIAHGVFNHVLRPIWNHFIDPAMRFASDVVKYCASKFEAGLKVTWDAICKLTETIFKKLLIPFWNHVIYPTLCGIKDLVHYTGKMFSAALDTLKSKIASSCQWIFQNVLKPFWNDFFLPALQFANKGLKFCANLVNTGLKMAQQVLHQITHKVACLAQWIFKHLIVSTWNKFLSPLLHQVRNFTETIVKTLVQSIQALSGIVKEIWSSSLKLLAPVFKNISGLLNSGRNLLNNFIIQPIISILSKASEKVSDIFKLLLAELIVPTVKLVTETTGRLMAGVNHFSQETWQMVSTTFNQLGQYFK